MIHGVSFSERVGTERGCAPPKKILEEIHMEIVHFGCHPNLGFHVRAYVRACVDRQRDKQTHHNSLHLSVPGSK